MMVTGGRDDSIQVGPSWHRRSRGGGRGGLGPPLEKLFSLAGQKGKLGRTKMGAWQDKNKSLA